MVAKTLLTFVNLWWLWGIMFAASGLLRLFIKTINFG